MSEAVDAERPPGDHDPSTARSGAAYRVRRSDRARRARLTVTREGEALVVLPRRAPERVAAALVAQHAGWLERHQGAARRRQAELAARPPLGDGRSLVVAGVSHQVAVVASGHRRSRVVPSPPDSRGVSTVVVEVAASDGRSVSGLVEAWLRRRAAQVVAERVAALAPVVGVHPSRLTVRGTRSRWGSASRSGALSFSWRLVLVPPDVLDYVVVHELVHLREPGHGPRFWAAVRRHAPQTDRARTWLRTHHLELVSALE